MYVFQLYICRKGMIDLGPKTNLDPEQEYKGEIHTTLMLFIGLLIACIIWTDWWWCWSLICGPLILFGIVTSYFAKKRWDTQIILDKEDEERSLKLTEERTKPCANCDSDFYAWDWEYSRPLSYCDECEKICKSCGEIIDSKFRSRNMNSTWAHYCSSCSSSLETQLNKHKTILFRRSQPQSNERKITDKEKQDCWERDQSPDEYYYWCDTIMHHNDDSMCSCTKMQESFGNSEEDLRKLRKAAFEMEIDFYRTVNPEPMVVLRCRECAIYQELISEDAVHTTEKGRSRSISEQVKNAVWRRDEGKCVQCGSNENLEFDHIIPHSKGGANTKRNIQLLCESCNRKKSDKI